MYQEFQTTERNTELLHEKFNVRKKTGWNILDGYDNIKLESDFKKIYLSHFLSSV